MDGPGEESQLYCKPVAKKPRTADAASSDDDSSADEAGGAAEAAPAPNRSTSTRTTPATATTWTASGRARRSTCASAIVRVGRGRPRAGARGLVQRGDKKRLADLERAVATHPALAVAPKEAPKLPRATVLGDDLEATVSFAAAPAPYLLLVADADAGAGGYRQQLLPRRLPPPVACGRGARRRAMI